MSEHWLTKGSRVRAEWFQANNPQGSLAGVQTKFSGKMRTVEGVVTHIRGDHPTDPETVHVWIQPDNGSEEVEVDLKHVKAAESK